MEVILYGKSINLINLAVMTFLYILTISVALCGTMKVENIKSILSLIFFKDISTNENEKKEGFTNISQKCSCKKGDAKCKSFKQNKYIDESLTHELNKNNAYELEPGSYDVETSAYSLLQ